VAELEDGALIECVESVQPPVPREKKWVLIVSTLKGCPIDCPICDAGGHYRGRLSAEEILSQVEFLVRRRYPTGRVRIPKLKVQFARMGDPALNEAVLEVLTTLPQHLDLPGLMPCISTVAPAGREAFFERLIDIKRRHYSDGRFQMQFSLHTTDDAARRRLIPARTWGLSQIAAYGGRFHESGDRKITLNFAPAVGLPLDPGALVARFSPEIFLIKLTPINPTQSAMRSGLQSAVDPLNPARCRELADHFRRAGYDTLLSIGEQQENQIGSNCGMFVSHVGAQRSSFAAAHQRSVCEPASSSFATRSQPTASSRRIE